MNKDHLAIIIGVVTTLIFCGLIYVYVDKSKELENISRDAETAYCRKNVLPERTVVIIDHTDSINEIQKDALEKRLWDIAADVKKNGSIRFYSVGRNTHNVVKADLDLCNPGNQDDVSDYTGNKRMAQKRYDELFSNAVREKMNSLLTAETASQSPIMKTVQAAVVNSFIGAENDAHIKKVIIVSDLLEHSEYFSMYHNDPNFESFRSGHSWASVRSDMDGIDVNLFWLSRRGAEKFQEPKLKTFWQMYFLEQGASEVKFTPIEG